MFYPRHIWLQGREISSNEGLRDLLEPKPGNELCSPESSIWNRTLERTEETQMLLVPPFNPVSPALAGTTQKPPSEPPEKPASFSFSLLLLPSLPFSIPHSLSFLIPSARFFLFLCRSASLSAHQPVNDPPNCCHRLQAQNPDKLLVPFLICFVFICFVTTWPQGTEFIWILEWLIQLSCPIPGHPAH